MLKWRILWNCRLTRLASAPSTLPFLLFPPLPSSALCLCQGTTAAERSDVVQVWAVGSGLLSCPPVTAPRRGHGAPGSGAGRSEASRVPSGCPFLQACAALPSDPLPPPVSCAHCEALRPKYCMSTALNQWATQMKRKAVWEGAGTGKEAKETINLLQSTLEPG